MKINRQTKDDAIGIMDRSGNNKVDFRKYWKETIRLQILPL